MEMVSLYCHSTRDDLRNGDEASTKYEISVYVCRRARSRFNLVLLLCVKRGESAMQEIFGLRYEFIYQHGRYMRLYKEDEGGLKDKDLLSLQVKMLEANEIPNLLPLEIHEMDHQIRLLYNLGSKRMLGHVLKVEGLTVSHFAKLLYAILCAIEESKNYLLYETGFVLKENFIFIGSDWSDLYLTYVPLDAHGMEMEMDMATTFIHFMKQMSLKITGDEKLELETWMESIPCNQTLLSYKKLLLQLMNKPTKQQIKRLPSPIRTQSELYTSPGLKSKLEEPAAIMKPDHPERSKSAKPVHKLVFTPVRTRTQRIVLTIAILASAFLWQNYVSAPSISSLHLTAGLTVLLANIWITVKFLGLPAYAALRDNTTAASDKSYARDSLEPQAEPSDIQSHYRNLYMHTTLLQHKEPNATIYLGAIVNKPPSPRLEWQDQEGVLKSVSLRSDTFSIGRGDATAGLDYVLEEAGVSRVHAEIMKGDDGYEVKDAGSTNGTSLNEEPLIAYQTYPLRDGDEIRIVRQTFIFRSQ